MPKAPRIEVIGIVAPTCAGKTTLLAELRRRLPSATTLSFDEYDLYPTGSEAMDRELVERSVTNWEDPALFDMEQFVADLGRLARGQTVYLQTRSRESLQAGEAQRTVTPSGLNIVEGVFVLHDERARALLDLSFFIDIPPEVMVERRLAAARFGDSTDPWDDPAYIAGPMVDGTRRNVLPQREYADVVLDGLQSTIHLADTVIESMNER